MSNDLPYCKSKDSWELWHTRNVQSSPDWRIDDMVQYPPQEEQPPEVKASASAAWALVCVVLVLCATAIIITALIVTH